MALVLCVALIAAATAGGCFWKKPAPTPTPQPAVTPPVTSDVTTTPPVEPPPVAEPATVAPQPASVDAKTGPLHVPQPGSAERQALANAARGRLKTSARFEVNQMFSNGAWAIAQLTPKGSTNSRFVAFRHNSAGWTAFWDGSVGSGGAKAIVAADSRISDEVVNAIQWKGIKTPDAEPKPGRPTNSEAMKVATTFVEKGNPDVKVTGSEVLGMVKDAKGRWWAWVLVKGPSNVDPLTVYMYKDGAWKLWDFGTEPKPVPKDVHF